jgi:nucleotide-binding universal stress UspA family protein
MFKSVLAHLTGSECDDGVMTAAKRIGESFAAHLECLHLRPNLAILAAAAIRPEGDEDSLEISNRFETLRQQVKDSAHRAHMAFTAFCRREGVPIAAAPPGPGGVSAAWHEKIAGDIGPLISEARFNDLVVVAGGAMAGDKLSSHELGDLILRCGRPVLLAGPQAIPSRIRSVAIAWKDSPEAARAITAAMPVLGVAEQIVLLSANEENETAAECIDCADSVVGHLRWQGFAAEGRYVIPAGRSIPDAVLETAQEAGADLVVMGAYGRSRLSERIFGGFTQRVLGGVALPVLIFH